jgi:hypothetical protein
MGEAHEASVGVGDRRWNIPKCIKKFFVLFTQVMIFHRVGVFSPINNNKYNAQPLISLEKNEACFSTAIKYIKHSP